MRQYEYPTQYFYIVFMHGDGRGTLTYGAEVISVDNCREFKIGQATHWLKEYLKLPLPPTIMSWRNISIEQFDELRAYMRAVYAEEMEKRENPDVVPLHPLAKVVKLPDPSSPS